MTRFIFTGFLRNSALGYFVCLIEVFFSRISHCKYGLILIQCADDFTLHFLLFLLIWPELTFFKRSFSFSDFDEITFDQICY